jgi:hypothetical protein
LSTLAFAKSAGFAIVGEYYDKAVSGADPVDQRPGFADMLLSLRGVSNELAARGFFNELGKPYAAKSVASMLA